MKNDIKPFNNEMISPTITFWQGSAADATKLKAAVKIQDKFETYFTDWFIFNIQIIELVCRAYIRGDGAESGEAEVTILASTSRRYPKNSIWRLTWDDAGFILSKAEAK